LEAVESLRNQYRKELEEKQIEIIVVDNASEKKVVDRIERGLSGRSGVTLIKNDENLGFGKGCNLGTKHSKAEFVLFLNSDTNTHDRGFLGMADFLKRNPKVAIAGGRLLNLDGSKQNSVGKFYNLLNLAITLFGGGKIGLLSSSPDQAKKVDWVTGACMMVSKNIFEKIGGFDKDFFMYMEDMELCYRAKKEGYDTYYYPKVSVIHKEQGSSNRGFAIVNIYKGILLFYKKHKSKLEYNIVRRFLWLKAGAVYLLGRLTNNSYYINTYKETLKIL